MSRHSDVNARSFRLRRLKHGPSRITIFAAAGTLLTAGAVTAAALAIGSASGAGSGAGHSPVRSFAMTGDLNRASYPGNADISAQEIRPYVARAQAAEAATAARRERARLAAMRLTAQRRAAATAHQTTTPSVAAAAPSGRPQQIAIAMLASFGWSSGQFSCLDSLWQRESGWNPYASNPSSGAYGIPQALPGSKMASAGADWATDAATQIRWGLGYIKATYGSPCGAWAHETADGWY